MNADKTKSKVLEMHSLGWTALRIRAALAKQSGKIGIYGKYDYDGTPKSKTILRWIEESRLQNGNGGEHETDS